MRGLVFWVVVALAISTGAWVTTWQKHQDDMLPKGSKLLAWGNFSTPVGGVAKVYHLPDGQGRIIFERLKMEPQLRLVAMLSHNPNAVDVSVGSFYLGEVHDARIQALDISPQARNISYSSIILVRPDQQSVWAKTTLERAY